MMLQYGNNVAHEPVASVLLRLSRFDIMIVVI